jgi:hypothetical protein
MAGELLIQVFDIGRFRAIRPALDELDAGRALSLESRAVLHEAAASRYARPSFAELAGRILRHPELELRVFLAPRELDGVIEDIVHVLCFEGWVEHPLTEPIGPSWVTLDLALRVFIDLDWFRATLFRPTFDPNAEAGLLAYPRAGLEGRYCVLSREDVARVAAGLGPLLEDPIPTETSTLLDRAAEQLRVQVPLYEAVREAAEGLARLTAKALSREELTLAHTSLL